MEVCIPQTRVCRFTIALASGDQPCRAIRYRPNQSVYLSIRDVRTFYDPFLFPSPPTASAATQVAASVRQRAMQVRQNICPEHRVASQHVAAPVAAPTKPAPSFPSLPRALPASGRPENAGADRE